MRDWDYELLVWTSRPVTVPIQVGNLWGLQDIRAGDVSSHLPVW